VQAHSVADVYARDRRLGKLQGSKCREGVQRPDFGYIAGDSGVVMYSKDQEALL
jgi:hypothetical protein